MRTRSWRWFRTRVLGLLTRPCTFDAHGRPVYPNRTQEALHAAASEPQPQAAHQ